MKIQPVPETPSPGYPDRYADETKALLAAARPRRWTGLPLAAGLLSAAALSLAGCSYTTSGTPVPAPGSNGPVPLEPDSAVSRPEGAAAQTAEVPVGEPGSGTVMLSFDTVFPLFEYGEGTGTIGCVAVAAPVFLSEEEAFAILSASFAEAGLTLERGAFTLKDAAVPVTDLNPSPKEQPEPIKTARGGLSADRLTDTAASLPLVFVSAQDLDAWQGDTGMYTSVSIYNIKETARTLAERNPGLAVFYDPVAKPDFSAVWEMRSQENEGKYSDAQVQAAFAAAESAAGAEAKRLLQEQAAAMMAWLDEARTD